MKRFVIFTLALALAAGTLSPVLLSASSEGGVNTEKELSTTENTKDTKENLAGGFSVASKGTVDILDAGTTTYIHDKTGAKVVHIESGSTDRFMRISFNTPSINDKGIPHVFEHAVLNGSEKYPSESLYMSLRSQTYNLGTNATTGPSNTMYFYSSQSEAQLLAVSDYLMDSVFFPNVLNDENLFMRESWGYELESPEAPLNVNGIVYNELKGALTIDMADYFNRKKALYPNSFEGNNFGGNPPDILTMTHQEIIDFHKAYYHPSNITVYLYGSLDINPFLEQIGGYCDRFEKADIIVETGAAEPLTEPVTKVFEYPADSSVVVENNGVIDYSIDLGRLTPEEFGAFNLLARILGVESSPVKQKLREALPNLNPTVGFNSTVSSEYIYFSSTGANESDMETFKTAINEALTEIITNGFDAEFIEAAIASEEYYLYDAANSYNTGQLIPNGMAAFSSANPEIDYWNDYLKGVEYGKENYRNGYLEKMIEGSLLNNPRSALSATIPVPGQKEVMDAELRASLDEIKANMTEQEIADLVASTSARYETSSQEETNRTLNDLTAVTVDTLPMDIVKYDVSDTEIDGVRFITSETKSSGINETKLALNSAAVGVEEMHYLNLYAFLLTQLPTENYDLETLQTKITRYLNDADISAESGENYDLSYSPVFTVSWRSLDGDYSEAVNLVSEILQNTVLTDTELLAGLLNQLKTIVQGNISDRWDDSAYMRAYASRIDSVAYDDYMNGLAFYEFIDKAISELETDPEGFTSKLEAVRAKISSKDEAAVLFAGNTDLVKDIQTNAAPLVSWLSDDPVTPADLSNIPRPSGSEGIVVDSAVQFNVAFASYEDLGIQHSNKYSVLMTILGDAYLLPIVRYENGAYGAYSIYSRYGLGLQSYRDPNIAKTFDAYREAGNFAADYEITQEDIDRYILREFSWQTQNRGDLYEAMTAAEDKLSNWPEDYKTMLLEETKSIKAEDFNEFSKHIAGIMEKGVIITAGSQSAIEENAELFDTIISPFETAE